MMVVVVGRWWLHWGNSSGKGITGGGEIMAVVEVVVAMMVALG